MSGAAQLALVIAAVVAVVAFVFVPRFIADDPMDSIGPKDSPARQVAAALEAQMDCTAGEISDKRAVLACYQQSADRVAMVFMQADRSGNVASYTAETHPLGGTPDTGETVALANQVAAIVTPGSDFNACSHDRSTPYFCFGSFATWKSPSLAPAQSTGEKKRLPTVDKIDKRFGKLGWDCSFGICTKTTATITTQQPLSGLALQYGAPLAVPDVKQTVSAFLAMVKDADELQEWASKLDGSLDIVVADRFVVGFVPQAGGGGLFVIDEVAGLVPDSA